MFDRQHRNVTNKY